MPFELHLPSEAVIEANGFGGKEIIAIAERVGANASGETLTTVMTSCHVGTLDPGPYPFLEAGPGKPNWNKLLWTDLLVAMLRLRIESFPSLLPGEQVLEAKPGQPPPPAPRTVGRTYEFEFSCEFCRHLCGGEIDLADLLADPDHYRPLPDASKARIAASQFFPLEVPGVGKVLFDLRRAEHDAPMRALLKREGRRKETDVESIAKRLKRVEAGGGKVYEQNDLRGMWRWCCGLSGDAIDQLLAGMEAAEGGLDTEITAWCDNMEQCGREQRISLPFGRTFFRPRAGTRKGATHRLGSSAASSPASAPTSGET